MTAIVVFIKPEAAYVLTDGVTANEPPVVGGSTTFHKAHVMPAHATVHVGRGNILMMAGIRAAMDTAGNLDRMSEQLPGRLREGRHHYETELGIPVGPSDHVLAGWSDRDNGFALRIVSDHNRNGWPPFEIMTAIGLVLPQGTVDMEEDMDPVADGLRIMEGQRELNPIIGGFCQLTTVHRHHIETRILRRWSS